LQIVFAEKRFASVLSRGVLRQRSKAQIMPVGSISIEVHFFYGMKSAKADFS